MKGDFSRSTFDPARHYSGVRMQQGRVQLDADWNENLDILRHRIETETIDVIGECGVPIHDAAFGVVTDFKILSQGEQDWLSAQGENSLASGDFYLTQGRAYVDGLLVENDHTLPFSQQPFVLPKGTLPPASPGIYLLYLDVWERHITALEDPSIREVALGGPDTATRSQTVWQARMAQVGKEGETITCADDLSPWAAPSTGTLSAQTIPQDTPDDPCPVPPGAGYKRLENQLYRVEIHKGSKMSGGPTFKWSRDNGSVVVAVAEVAVDGSNTKIRTTSLGRDDVLGLHENDWVELLDDATELAGLPGTLLQIIKIEPEDILTLSGDASAYQVNDPAGNPTHLKVRRWDSDGEIAIPLPDNDYLPLEGGVEVKFDTNGTFQTGDYWQIPARTVPGQYGDIEWPQAGSNPAALTPFGIRHHYCKLALLTVASPGSTTTPLTLLEDCRKQFPPLTELPAGGECCCSVTVGQGGDYPDLPSALAARPQDADGWTVCVLPGVLGLKDTLTVSGTVNLALRGCGRQSRLLAPAGKPAFAFSKGTGIKLEGLWIEAASPEGAILFDHCLSVNVTGCSAFNTGTPPAVSAPGSFDLAGPVIVAARCKQLDIQGNDLVGLPAIQADGQLIDVLNNRMMGGGVQIIPPSVSVRIEENKITQGKGPGVQLGGGDRTSADFVGMYYSAEWMDQPGGLPAQHTFTPASKAGNFLAGIRQVAISRNLIGDMTGSGIITEASFTNPAQLGDVEALRISDNDILQCCQAPDVTLSDASQVGGGIAALGLFDTQIVDNRIAWNGQEAQAACGIFLLEGSDIEIGGNVILENGSTEDADEPGAYQAGIAAQYILGNYLSSTFVKEGASGLPGYPALRVHDNQVICPAGQALSILAVGGVLVTDNTLATRERKKQPTDPLDFGQKGACVYVLDLGLPVWYQDIALLLQMALSGQTNVHLEGLQQVSALLARFPDGRVLFHDNQVTFRTDVEETIESLGAQDNQWFQRAWDAVTFSILLTSLDDISLEGNQFQATVPLYWQIALSKAQEGKFTTADWLAYLLKFIQVGVLGTVLRATGNGITERLLSNYVSYASNATAMNLTTGNQATHLILANGPTNKNVVANNQTLLS